MAVMKSITECVGNTPLLALQKLFESQNAMIMAKLESCNPGSSVKDRIGLAMIAAAERDGKLQPGSVVVEPTSGNTGIALAWVCAVKGYRLVLVMPDSMSIERRQFLNALGAEIVLTSGAEGMTGAVDKARSLCDEIPCSFMPQQFENPENPLAHYRTTGPEIWRDTGGKVDIFVTGVGTGGTISGVGRFLKEKKSSVKIFAVEPETSPVLSRGLAGAHRIQGIGAGFIPGVLDRSVIDDVITVTYEDARDMTRRLAREEGVLAGISTGANLYAAKLLAEREENRGKAIVTTICDTGERYLSTDVF